MTSNTLSVVRQYLKSHNVLCLATSLQDQPWVSPVFYACTSTGLVFLSAPHTRHCKNLAANPKVSASIQREYSDWQVIKGLQLEGSAGIVPDHLREKLIAQYAGKFPVTGDHAPPEISRALDKIQWYQVVVSKLFYIDNAKGLGHREDLDPALLFTSQLS